MGGLIGRRLLRIRAVHAEEQGQTDQQGDQTAVARGALSNLDTMHLAVFTFFVL